jgi:hypothetical protein
MSKFTEPTSTTTPTTITNLSKEEIKLKQHPRKTTIIKIIINHPTTIIKPQDTLRSPAIQHQHSLLISSKITISKHPTPTSKTPISKIMDSLIQIM